MALIEKKIRGYTLVETLTALVLMMLVFGMAMIIFMNVYKTSKSELHLAVHSNMKQIVNETKTTNTYINKTFEYKSYTIHSSFQRYLEAETLLWIKMEAYDQTGRLITIHNELLIDY